MRHFHAPFGFVGTDGGGGGSGSEGGASNAGADKTLTQADVDRIVSDRLNRQRSQFADYDDLKTKAAELDELKRSQQSDVEKANAKASELEKSNADKDREIAALRLHGRVFALATERKFHDPDAALKLLDVAAVKYDASGEPSNVDALLDALATQKPYLVTEASNGSADGGARKPPGGAQDPNDYREHAKKLPKF